MTEHTFAFVDLAGFTALTEVHGDAEAVAMLARFRAITEQALGPDDHFVKTIGDAVMLAFHDAPAAITALRRLFAGVAADESMPLVRGGAHHGTAVRDGDDFFGAAVNLAARVAGHAAGGQLLCTEAVALAARDAELVVTHAGSVELRNVRGAVDLYDIEFDGREHVAIDPVCQMKVPTSGPSVIRLTHDEHDVWFCGLPCVVRFAEEPARYVAR